MTHTNPEIISDDGNLLKDRLLRSLHRNKDGHLNATTQHHEKHVKPEHNVAVLFTYTREDDAYTLFEHYVYTSDSHNYEGWRRIVYAEIAQIEQAPPKYWLGVYGWITSRVAISPLRNGDIFIKIDDSGALGVRLTFGARKNRNGTQKKTARKKR